MTEFVIHAKGASADGDAAVEAAIDTLRGLGYKVTAYKDGGSFPQGGPVETNVSVEREMRASGRKRGGKSAHLKALTDMKAEDAKLSASEVTGGDNLKDSKDE